MKKLFINILTMMALGITNLNYAAPVDINSADAVTLDRELKQIGPKKAQAIVEYRKTHIFNNADDLTKVPGISQKIVDQNRANIIIGTPINSGAKTNAPAAPVATTSSPPPAATPSNTNKTVAPAPTPSSPTTTPAPIK